MGNNVKELRYKITMVDGKYVCVYDKLRKVDLIMLSDQFDMIKNRKLEKETFGEDLHD